ncbi:hypothetical protein DFH08DRAFT_951627 [Mycena albidolilacea]|uniref:Copper transporter n=1 Tax=Mycena albidolilacea TaxID=1033008 RepID=A0AAD7AJQ2_9AGAR|nr:hypothetical protein DFH08DRAFT_951627 [Mycena albidolilacea]
MADAGDTLHWSSQGTHVLFSFIQIDYFGGFVLGALFTTVLCLLERLITYTFETRWAPASIRRVRAANALWRAALYWVLAMLRLAYMLIAMTLNAGLILIAVTTLALGQLCIELRTPPRGGDRDYASLEGAPMYTLADREDAESKPEGRFTQTQSNGHEGNGALLGHTKRGSAGGARYSLGGGEDSDSDS